MNYYMGLSARNKVYYYYYMGLSVRNKMNYYMGLSVRNKACHYIPTSNYGLNLSTQVEANYVPSGHHTKLTTKGNIFTLKSILKH